MFYKLISNLQYSPGLIGQIGFYSRRLRQEEFIRRMGLAFSIVALTLQAFLIMSPPQPSLASSGNDIIYGGGSKDRIISAYRNNRDDLGRTDIQAIFNRFGVGEAELARASDVTIQSRAENGFYSIGRNKRFSSAIEHTVDVPGHAPVFSRPLHAWDSGAYSTYGALYGINNSGQEFWVLKNCGNIVMKTPTPSPLPPNVQVEKKVIEPASSTVSRGQDIVYAITYRNVGPGTAGLLAIEDLIPAHTTYVSSNGPLKWFRDGKLHWDHVDESTNPYGILGVTDWYHQVNFRVRVNDDAPDGAKICNIATITTVNGTPSSSNPTSACRTVHVPPPPPASATCTLLSYTKKTRDVFEFTASGDVQNGATIDSYEFRFGDDTTETIESDERNISTVEHMYAEPGNYTVQAIANTSEGAKASNSCVVEIDVTEPEGTPEVVHQKNARNVTRNVDDANGTTAQAGDEIEYSLITRNIGDAPAVDFVLPAEDIADVLEYADIVELGDATFNEEEKELTWDPVTIEPSEEIVKKFIVKIKDPIPKTPVSASDPGSFDLVLSNSYGGEQVEIKLPPPNNKRVESVVKELPNTGVGDSIITSTFLIGMSTYFYSRNRLISKELKLIKKEFTHGGTA